jgi:hypothetical protein
MNRCRSRLCPKSLPNPYRIESEITIPRSSAPTMRGNLATFLKTRKPAMSRTTSSGGLGPKAPRKRRKKTPK